MDAPHFDWLYRPSTETIGGKQSVCTCAGPMGPNGGDDLLKPLGLLQMTDHADLSGHTAIVHIFAVDRGIIAHSRYIAL